MATVKTRTCQICKTPFRAARKDAKTCSPACRKKLQRSLQAQAIEKATRLESALGQEFHRLASSLFKQHAAYAPLLADERGGIPVADAPQETQAESPAEVSTADASPVTPLAVSTVEAAPVEPAPAEVSPEPVAVPTEVAEPVPAEAQPATAGATVPESLEAEAPSEAVVAEPSTPTTPETASEAAPVITGTGEAAQPAESPVAGDSLEATEADPLSGTSLAEEEPEEPRQKAGLFSRLSYPKLALLVTGAAVVIIALLGTTSFLLVGRHKAQTSQSPAARIGNYSVGNLQTSGLKPNQDLTLGQADTVTVNGQLKVNNSLVLAPSATPNNPTTGEIYFDQTANAPFYYNGSQFVSLAPQPIPQHVTTIGGASGVVSVGNGLNVVNNQLGISAALLQEINGVGSNGVLSLAGTPNQISVSSSTGHIVLSLPQNIAPSSSPVFSNLQLTSLGAGVVQSDSSGVLSSGTINVANGGTGATSFTANGVIFGNGSGPLQATNSLANAVLVTNGSGVPSLSQTLPLGVQNNITQTGQLVVGSINSGFGAISTNNNITTSALVQAGSLEVDGGSFTIDNLGNFNSQGSGVVEGAGGLTIGVAGTTNGQLTLASTGSTFTTTVQAIAQAGRNQTITIPASNVASDTVCLLFLGNCTGSGSGVTSVGTQGYIARFSNAAANQIGNSLLFDNGVSVGLGTITPSASYLLDINGNLHVAGTTTLSNNLTVASANISQTGTGTFSTGTGAVNLNGATSVTGSNTLTVGTGATTLGGTLDVTTGLTTLSGGLSVSNSATIVGTTNINASGTSNTFIGNATGTFGVASSGLNISTGGAVSGVTSYIQTSGNFSQTGTGTFSTGTGTVSLNGHVVAAGTVDVQGGNLTIGVAGTTAGTVSLANGTNTNLSVIASSAPTGTGNATYTLPSIAGGSSDTVCLLSLANCSGAGGPAGGDLTGTYPNPTIAKLQGTTLTLSSLASGDVLQYNGSAIVNGHITNSNLTAGTFTNITGTGALTTGSIGVGFGNINIGSSVFTGDGSGLTNLNGSNVASGTVANARLVNSGALTVTAGTGLSGGGSVALGGTTTLNVVYGSSAGTAAQGNTALSFTGAGNLTGTVSGTAGGGFTTNTLDIVASPTFSGNLAVEGTNGVTIGNSGATAGVLRLANTSNTNLSVITASAPSGTGNATYTLPSIAGGSSDTICLLTLGNCSASGAAGGDLAGNYPNPTVAKLQGTTLTLSSLASGDVLQYNGSAIVNGHITNSNLTAGTFTNITGTGALTTGSIGVGFGNINIGSNVFTGNGSGLSNLNASNIATGTLNDSRLSTNVTLQGNTFNGASQLVQLTAGGALPVLDGSNLTNLNGSAVASGTVANARLVNSGALTVTAGTGLSGGGSVALGGTTTLNVVYGSSAGTAAQGNTTLTCASGTGNLSGGGNSFALGSGGSCGNITITNSPTFTGTLAVQGSGGITVGVAGTTAGTVSLANGTNTNLSVITASAPSGTGNATYTLPTIVGGSSDTICLQTLANCTFSGTTAGGDLTGTYPNPTIAKLQGTTLTLSSLASGDVLQYNGSAIVNGHITNSNLTAGTFTNITGTGALVAGSIASGFGTISTGNNITTTATVQGGIVNATSALQLNGNNINAAGTLNNVAYLNGTGPQTFTGNNKFTGTFLDRNASDSTTAFQIQNAGGTSNLFVADTTDSRIGLGVVPITTAGSGLLQVGASGSTTADQGISFGGDASANLYRGAAGEVDTDGALNVNGGYIFISGPTSEVGIYRDGYIQPINTSPTDLAFNTAVYGESFGRFSILTDGSIHWSGGGAPSDTTLYRSTAGVLKTDGTFNVGTALQTNGITRIDSSGNLTNIGTITSGLINGQTISSSANFTGTLSVSGSTLTVGTPGTTVGSINLSTSAANSRQVIIQGLNPSGSGNATIRIPTIAGGSTDTVCLLTLANCAGTGSGITGSGTAGTIAVFTGTGSIGNSHLTESGTTLTYSGNVAIQGASSLALGTASANTGSVTFNNSTNGNTITLQAGASASNLTFTLPTADGANGDCLMTNASGVLSFHACTGGPGGGVTSLDGLTGILTINNSSGSGSAVTINNAKADASTKGIATFNATNFTDNGSGVINTAQNISTSSSPVFVSPNATTGINTGAGAGTQRIDASGNLTNIGTITSGLINGQTISSSANFTGTVAIQGANALTLGTTGTNTGAIIFKGSTAASGTITLQGPANPSTSNYTLSIPTLTGNDTLCVATLANCTAIGAAGGDLTGTYPNPTIAKLQGTTLTLSSLASGDVLQYNGSAIVNGHITNSNLTAGTFTNITGTGALVAGSIASGFGTISTGNNITTTATVQGGIVNATTTLELGGADINTAGTLGNVAYKNAANTFTAAQTVKVTSTNALVVQSASSVNVLTVDTSGQRVAVGPAAVPANGVLTVGTNTTANTGGIYFGTDTNLYRSDVGVLQTDGDFAAQGSLFATGDISTELPTDTSHRAALSQNADGSGHAGLVLGPGTTGVDTSLYRSAVAQLTTNGALIVTNQLTANGGIVTNNTNINAGTGTITSGLINGQTISSSASLTGTLAVATSVSTPTVKVTSGSFAVSISSATQANNVALSIPADTNSSDTICLQTLANCTFSGTTAGGDLTGTYPNPTIAKLQGTTLTLSSLASGDVLQYNGSAIVNGHITNSNLTAGTFTNITGTGALVAGSIASGFGTISTGNNITTTATVQGGIVNATSALQLNGNNINAAGTLNNVAYLNQANNFSAAQTISNTGGKTTLALTSTGANTGITFGGDTTLYRSTTSTLKTDNDFVVGGNLTATGTINGATISGGTLSGGNVSGGTLTATSVNGLSVSAGTINNPTISGTITGSGSPTITGFGAIAAGTYNGQTITSAANFTGTLAVQGSGGITVGVAGTTAGTVSLANGTNTNLSVITASAPSGTGNATYTLPTIVGGSSDTICLQTLANCTFSGTTAGGDLTGTYPNPTIAKLQGTTLTLSSLASGDVLQYNGSAIVNGHITNSNLTAGTFTNITGTGALVAGSIASGFGTISTGNNITTTATVQGGIVNATTTLELGGADINTAGTLGNVAYKNAANTFTQGQTINANSIGLAITGTPTPGTGITSLVQIGQAIAAGNTAVNGGTYLGLNRPGSGAGSAADYLNFENNGTSVLKVDSSANITATGTFNTATISGGSLSSSAVNGLSVSAGTINNPTISGTITGSGSPTITGFGAIAAGTYNGQTISSTANFTGTVAIQGGNSLVLGTSSSNTGSTKFLSASGTGSITLTPANPGSTAYTLTLPAENGTLCSTGSVCAGYAPSTGGSYIAKNAADTSSASVTGNLLGLTNSNTGAAGVLSLTNSGTNSALSILQSGTSEPGSLQALILANNNTTTPSGNLLDLQNKGTSELHVDVSGNLTTLGGITLGSLGTNDTNSVICRNSTNQLALCSGSGSGSPFVQGGNSFGAPAVLGTNDSNSLSLKTNGATQATIAVGGATTFQNSADSTAAFQIQNAAGTSNLFVADTTNSRIGLGVTPITTAGSGLLQVGAASSTTAAQGISFGGDTVANLYRSAAGVIKTDGSFTIANGQFLNFADAGGANGLRIGVNTGGGNTAFIQQNNFADLTISTGSNGRLILSPGGASNTGVLVKPAANSTAAFQVQNTSSIAALNVNTSTLTTTVRAGTDGATLGSELNTTTDFTNIAWTTTGWTAATTTATHNTGNTSVLSTNQFTPTNGAIYQVSYQLSGSPAAASTLNVKLGGTTCASYTFSGTAGIDNVTDTVLCAAGASSPALQFTPSSTYNGVISNVSVKLVTQNTAPALVVSTFNGGGTAAANLEVRTSASTTNLFIGLNSGKSITTGTQNTALGGSALQNNTSGSNNTAIGAGALQVNTTGASNTALGTTALQFNTSGSSNTALGTATLLANTTGSNNTAVGGNALKANISGTSNTAVGTNALTAATTATDNTAVGLSALATTTTGGFNVAVGRNALTLDTSNSNVAVGYSALSSNSSGSKNTALGLQAGVTATSANANTTGSGNTFIGYNSGPGSTTQFSNASAIGAFATVNQSDSLVLGCVSGTNGCTANTKIGIDNATPGHTLDVVGDGQFTSALNLTDTGGTSAGGLVFGTDTTLYRSNAGELTSNGNLVLQGGSLLTNQTTANLFNTTATTLNIGGAVGAGGINLAGGSGSTGCTIDGSNGNLTCTGNITGGSTGTVGYWSRGGTTLQPATAGDAITTSGNISTTGSGTITSAGLLTGSAGLTITGGTANINASGSGATNIGSTGSGGAVAIQSASTIGLTSGTTLGLTSTGSNNINITPGGGTNTGVLVKPTANSTGAFVVQNAAGTANALSVDTTDLTVGIASTPSATVGLTVWGGTSNLGIVVDQATSNTNDLLNLRHNGTPVAIIGSTGAATFKNSSNSTAAFQIQNATGSVALNVSTNSATNAVLDVGGTGYTDSQITFRRGATETYSIGSNGAGPGGSNGLFVYNEVAGKYVFSLDTNGAALFKNGTDSTAGFQIQNATGTSNLFIADTTNSRIGLGVAPITTAGSGLLQVGAGGSTTAAQGISFGGDTVANLYRSDVATLQTDGTLSVGTDIYAAGIISSELATDSDHRVALTQTAGGAGKAGIVFGPGTSATDTTLYRSNAAELTTNGNLVLQGGSLLTNQTTANLFATTATTVNIGTAVTSASGGLNLAGGSGSTGCSVNGNTGDFLCSGNISSVSTSGTQGWWSRSGTTLQPATAGDALTTSGNISTTGSGTITSAGLLTGSAGLTVTGGTANINASGSGATNIGSTGSGGAVAIRSASTIALTSGTTLSLTSTGANNINITPGGGSNTGVLITPTTNSTNAFQIQNAAGTNNSDTLLGVSSVYNAGNVISNGSFEIDTSGWAAKGNMAISQVSNQTPPFGSGAMQITNSGTPALLDGAKFPVSLSSSTTYSMSFFVKLASGTFSTVAFGRADNGSTDTACSTTGSATTTGWIRQSCTFTTGTVSGSPYVFIGQNDTTGRTFYVDGVSVEAVTAGTYYKEGGINLGGAAITSDVLIQPASTNAAFIVAAPNGSQGLAVNTNASLLTTTFATTVAIASTTNTALTVTNNSALTNTLVSIGDSNASQTTATLLNVAQTGVAGGYTGNVVNFSGTSTSGGGNLLNLSFSSNTSGAALNISGGTGAAIQIANGNIIDLASGSNGNTAIMKIATATTCASGSAQGLIFKSGSTQVGHICTTGTGSQWYGTAFNASSTDVAENYSDVNNDLAPGDLVALDTSGPTKSIVKADASNQSNIIGVVSTSPGLLLSGINEANGSTDLTNPKPVALSGRVPTNVSTENGPIAVGDYLTVSSTSGVAMKATSPGLAIGRALEAYNGSGVGSIEVMTSVGYYAGGSGSSTPLQNGGDASLANLSVSGNTTLANLDVTGDTHLADLNVSGPSTLASLNVTGDANVGGSLTVAGNANINGSLKVTGLTTVADIVVSGHIITAGGQPTAQAQGAIGTGASVAVDGTDTTGTITITTGTTPTSGDLAKILFSKTYGKAPHIVLSASNDKAAGLRFFKGNTSSTDFMFDALDNPAPNTTYTFDYFIAQ